MNEEIIRIEDILDALKSRWQLIVSITLIATILSAAASFFLIKPKYEASTKLFIGKENSDTEQTYSNSDVQMYQNLLATYSDIITTKDLIENAFEDTSIELNASDVLDNLTVTPKTDTQILVISYISTDKEEAKDVVDAVANEFVEESSTLISNANVQIVEKVTLPEEAVSPNKKLNIAIAMLLGLMIGVGLAFLLEYMDNTFKDKDQVESIIGLPVLGAIPDLDKVK